MSTTQQSKYPGGMNHKFLTAEAIHPDEAGYTVEDGVILDDEDGTRPNARKVYDEWTRYWPKTSEEKKAEEAAWAAKSGPVTIIRKGKVAA